MTTVSVALATYQGAAHLREQLQSILNQSVPPDELVVGDDGSTDGSVDIVTAGFAAAAVDGASVPQLRVLDGPSAPEPQHRGVTANFSRVLAEASGDVVVLCDQDDVWMPDRVAAALEVFAARSETLLVFSDAELIDADGRGLARTLFESLPVRPDELRAARDGDAVGALLRRNVVTGATTAVRAELLDAALPIPETWLHDEWLAIIAALTGGIAVIERPLIGYRQHDSNVVGVAAPTLRYRIARMLEPRGDRLTRLAARSADLAAWHGLSLASSSDRDRVHAKAAFDRRRASLPGSRPRRIPAVLRLAARGGYRRFSSQGALDIVRDLLQPA